MRSAFLLLLVSILLPAPTQADTIHPEARARLDSATAHYEAGNYEDAISDFRVAYEIDPQPRVLFAWAQAERKSGDCRSAVRLMNKYLESRPPERAAQVARQVIETCEAALATRPPEPEPKPEPPPPPMPTVIPPPPAPPPGVRTPWYADPIGDTLGVAGLIGLGVGTTFFIRSSATQSEVEHATNYAEYNKAIDSARSQRTFAIIGVATGSALLTAAIIRWLTRDSAPEATSVVGWTDGDRGAGLSLVGRF